MGFLEYFTTSFLPLWIMLIIPALTQVSDTPTLFIGWYGSKKYAKYKFMLHKVNIPISNVQDCRSFTQFKCTKLIWSYVCINEMIGWFITLSSLENKVQKNQDQDQFIQSSDQLVRLKLYKRSRMFIKFFEFRVLPKPFQANVPSVFPLKTPEN